MDFFLDTGERVALATEDTGPKWHLMFPRGVKRHRADFPNGVIEFSPDVLAAMVNNYGAEGRPERAVNYFHKGASSAPGRPEEKVAAGWISDLRLTDRGLEALIKWTERARGFILADELRYLSPEFALNATSKATGKPQGPTLFGAALLNDPYLTELPRVAASETPNPGDAVKNIALALNLAEDATTENIEAAVKALAEQVATEKARAEKAEESAKLAEENSAAKLTELSGQVASLSEQVAKYEKDAADAAAREHERAVKAKVEGLVKAGKVTPAMREGVEALALRHGVDSISFFDNAPAIVKPNDEKGVTGNDNVDPKAEAVTRFNSKVTEHQAKGAKYADAIKLAKAELPDEYALVFSR